MNYKKYLTFLLFLIIFGCSTVEKNKNPVIGVWEIETVAWNDSLMTPLEPNQIKIFTEKHVIYTWHNFENENSPDTLLSVGFGEYIYNENSGFVTETIKVHSNQNMVGSSFNYKVVKYGTSFYIQDVELLDGNILTETWRRVE